MIIVMGHLSFGMLREFKCTWRNKFDISHQMTVLKLLIAICQETNTRKQMIAHILFKQIKYVLVFRNLTIMFSDRFVLN